MARTPQHDSAAMELALGKRGMLSVTSNNRANVRNWLTANNVSSTLARGLALSDLQAVYNDHSNTLLSAYQARSRNIIDSDTDEADQDDAIPMPAPKADLGLPPGGAIIMPPLNGKTGTQHHAEKAEAAKPANNAAAKLSAGLIALVEELASRPSGIDEPAVRELIQQELSSDRMAAIIAKHAPAITIKIEKAEPRELKIEGLRHEAFPNIAKMIGAGLHVALVGPAGSGKTSLAHHVADALGLDFQFTGAIASEYKLAGFIDANGVYRSTAFRKAFEHGGLFLFDEIDASLPAALLAFNAALANGYADFPDGKVKRHENFRCLAAANTYWTGQDRVYVGRNQLDGASLDRFAFVDLPYDEKLERAIAGDDKWTGYVQKARKAAAEQKIRHVISPRASMSGAKLLAAGLDMDTVANAVLWKGLDAATVSKIKAGIR